jgi:alkanesulfonate monooxygenase SsuD/methylene tetrahydromethanopterin reductase-like flavin-dependent oxidoreductase (luciferase family)
MKIGFQMLCQSWGGDVPDSQVYSEEIKLAVMADEMGYDSISVVEHHFEDYSFCPDNFVLLAFLASKTKKAKLMTAAVILPWNDPLRVAEKAALLDELCDGRLVLGVGRGLSQREYKQFGKSMEESRGRFDESIKMIMGALKTGVMEEHNGQYFKQPRAVIRPRPTRSFEGRLTQVAMSGDSVLEAAVNKAKMMQFSYKPMAAHKKEIDAYAAEYRRLHKVAPPVPYFIDLSVCDRDAGRAAANSRKYVTDYLLSVMHHYEMLGEHFANAKGYEEYGQAAVAMREAGMEAVAEAYLDGQICGTPQQMMDKIIKRREIVGDFDLMLCFRFAGSPFEVSSRSLETFAKYVMPELRNLNMATELAA